MVYVCDHEIQFPLLTQPGQHVQHAHRHRLLLEQLAESPARAERLGRRDPYPRAARIVGERVDLARSAARIPLGGPARFDRFVTTARPATRAADLAAAVGRETLPFKLDVRKLKALGLTRSFAVGYEVSPRGLAYLERSTRR